ncbi:hypothetical protein [Bdellovibrio bacteriovorus]|uniref:hypothetical protein n=1 Tax=Bdellovibrio bacteriovorus TaxID=959 RepID=UPI0035A72324
MVKKKEQIKPKTKTKKEQKKKGIDDQLADGGATTIIDGKDAEDFVNSLAKMDADSSSQGVEPTHSIAFSNWLRTFENRIQRLTQTDNGDKWYSITNFGGEIVDVIIDDSGDQRVTYFVVELTFQSGEKVRTDRITTRQFDDMSWLRTYGTYKAKYVPDAKNLLAIRTAISDNSKELSERKLRAEIGWVKQDGKLSFIHASGIISAEQNVGHEFVDVDDDLARFEQEDFFPELSTEQLFKKCEEVYVNLPGSATCVGRGAVYRAPLNHFVPCNCSLIAVGRTGSYKSSWAGILQASYGKSFDYTMFPASWESTANSIERAIHNFKDVLAVIDDFAPNAEGVNSDELYQRAERVIRSIGNSSHRGRLNGEFKLQKQLPPRATVIITAEDLPRGHSVLGRSLIVEFSPGQITTDVLDVAQAAARAGLFVSLQKRYLQYLAKQQLEAQTVREERSVLAAKFNGLGGHARLPENLANYALGWKYFFDFLVKASAVTKQEAELRMETVFTELRDLGRQQLKFIKTADAVEDFFAHLRYSMTVGQSFMADKNGGKPANFQHLGWRKIAETNTPVDWVTSAHATKIGWHCTEEGFYLDWETAYRQAQKAAASVGGSLKTSSNILKKRISEAGFSMKNELEQKDRLRRVIEGETKRVLVITERRLLIPD